MNFADRLDAAIHEKSSPCLLGLDPHLALLPEEFSTAADPAAPRADRAECVADFLCQLLDLCRDRVAIVKPQSAFFEVLGADGAAAWERVVAHAHAQGLLVIGDVKRGDIASTAAAYATAYLEGSGDPNDPSLCDAITVNPFLGSDTLDPFLEVARRTDKGLYILVRTSNPGSDDLQEHGDPPLVHKLCDHVTRWGAETVGECGLSSIGAVVGATHAAALADLRARLPHTPLLLPGFGAQGAGPLDVKPGFTAGLSGAIVNSSRGIAFAYRKANTSDWRSAADRAMDEMLEGLRGALVPGATA
jgi:orotidine-5'-phosphate decarboxylase